MNRFLQLIVFMIFSLQAVASGSCKELPPVEDVICNMNAKFLTCKLTVQVELLKGSPLDKAYACIEESKSKVKPLYKAAKNSLNGNEDAIEALKDAFSYWMSSLDALQAKYQEKRYQYDRRIAEREQGMIDKANRLRLEVD